MFEDIGYFIFGLVISSVIAYFFLFKTKENKQEKTKTNNQAQERNLELQTDQPKKENLTTKTETKKEEINEKTNDQFSFSETSYALPSLTILYGTQKGTAERFSRILEKQAKEKGWEAVQVVDLEEYEFDDITSEELVIFIVATYIEGTYVS